MHIKRKFPNNQELSFSWKQAVELNIMLMDPFFNQQLTNREREIIYWAVLHTESGEAEGVELKQKILDSAKMSNMATLTEYFSKLRGKHCFIYNPKSTGPLKSQVRLPSLPNCLSKLPSGLYFASAKS